MILAEGLFLLTVLLLASVEISWLRGTSKGSGMLEMLIDSGSLQQSHMSGSPYHHEPDNYAPHAC